MRFRVASSLKYVKTLKIVVSSIYLVSLGGCEDPPDIDIIGIWIEAVTQTNQSEARYSNNCYPENDDGGYSATWEFRADGSYQLDFALWSISGARIGHSSGNYDFFSDSILVLVTTYYEYQDSVVTETLVDTQYVSVTNTTMIQRVAELNCNIYWKREN